MNQVPDSVALEDVPCPLGCPADDKLVLQASDRLHNLPGVFNLVQCKHCKLIRTNPRPTQDTIGYYYPSDYAPHRIRDMPQPGQNSRSSWKRRLTKLIDGAQLLPDLPAGRMLEIGCATGTFLDEMKQLGWVADGIEFSREAAEVAREHGHKVQIASLETAVGPAETYDLVVGWMVLEHLHNPLEALQKLHAWTNTGGWLVLSVPDISALDFRIFKDQWYALQLPTHLFHYTPASLSRLLDKSGWTTRKIGWRNNSGNTWRSLKNYAEIHGKPGLLRFSDDIIERGRHKYIKRLLSVTYGLLRQSGRMVIWARRN